MDINYVEKHTIFSTVVGSRAYGTNRPDSDYDQAGVMIPGKEYFFGLDRFEQFQGFPGVDKTIYDIRKALRLISDCNPNMVDLLFVPERCIKVMTPYWETILKHRESFISRKARWTYAGYAHAQFERIMTHRKFLLDPPKKEPVREDFGLPAVSRFPTAQLKAIVYSALEDFLVQEEKENFLDQLDDVYSNYIIPLFTRYIKEDRRKLALEYLQVGIKSQANTLRALGPSYIKEEFLDEATKELQYYSARQEWDRFMDWQKHRNKARAALEAKFGYDCYSEDTEFLTNTGWKKYDEITEKDFLATVFLGNYTHRKQFHIEYQKFIDRFDGLFNGNMYNLYGNHLDVLVTPNHRMLFRKKERKSKKITPFVLEEITTLPDTFEILIAPKPRTKNYKNKEFKGLPIKDTKYMKLMGWYLSDGCMNMGKYGPKCIRISQKKNGRLHWLMHRFKKEVEGKVACHIYESKRKPNKFNSNEITEIVMTISDKKIREKMLLDCGRLKKKRIPRYVFNLSLTLKEFLFNALVGGDGTFRNTSFKSIIYYTSLKNLADDVQELALSCGWETSLYGPYKEEKDGYEIDMYQVHVNKNKDQFKTCMKFQNVKKIPVTNQRIVCFTVPNGTLITRRNGHIGIHGNSKHAMHLVRLSRMCIEILTTGKVSVDRTGIDAEELITIRDGAWSFEKIKEYTDTIDEKADALYKTSKLQRAPDINKIKEVCVEVCERFILEKRTIMDVMSMILHSTKEK